MTERKPVGTSWEMRTARDMRNSPALLSHQQALEPTTA